MRNEGCLDELTSSSVLSEVSIAEQPGDSIGRYKLLAKIGEGGCGCVYLAEQMEPVRRKVAVKIVKLGMDSVQVLGRFEAERQALALMEHGNIAKVLDGGMTSTGRPFFVMELVRGRAITLYCDERRLNIRKRLEMFVRVCDAIQHAHQKGVIHRDIKPSNILVCEVNGSPIPRVIDFGIAKATRGQKLTKETDLTSYHQFMGTPAYVSPEMATLDGANVDTRTDIYSLGALLYELLAGTPPFYGVEMKEISLEEFCRVVREKDPFRPSFRISKLKPSQQSAISQSRGCDSDKLVKAIRDDLDWIVMKSLEKEPQRRYETPNALAGDIQRHLKYVPVIARPPTWTYRLGKTVYRHRLICIAATLFLLTLLFGIAALAIGLRQAQFERERARALRYCSDMGLAWRALRDENFSEVNSLLAAQIPGRHEHDYREWEWRYLSRVAKPQELFLLGPMGSEVIGLVSLPEGELVTGELDEGTIKIWDTAGRRVLRQSALESGVSDLVVSRDGNRLAAATWGKSIVLLNSKTLAVIGKFIRPHQIQGVAFSPDGKALSAAGPEGVSVLDLPTGQWRWSRLAIAGDLARAPFSPDGRWVIYPQDQQHLAVIDAVEGRVLRRIEIKPTLVSRLAISPDGERLAVASWNGGLSLVDLRTDEMQIVDNHAAAVRSVVFSPDATHLASAGNDGLVRLWEVDPPRAVASFHGHGLLISALNYSADGQQLFSGGKDRTVRAWPTLPMSRRRRPLVPEGYYAKDLAWDATTVFAVNTNGIWCTFNTDTGAQTQSIRCEQPWTVMAGTSDGQDLAFGHADGTVDLWNVSTHSHTWHLKAHSRNVDALTFSQDGRRLATAARGGTVRVWDRNATKPIFERQLGQPDEHVFSLAFSADGCRIAVPTFGFIHLLDLGPKTGERVLPANANFVTFSRDDQFLATAHDNFIEIWDTLTSKQVAKLSGIVSSFDQVRFSPDCRRIIGASSDAGLVILWDRDSGREVVRFSGLLAGFRRSNDTLVLVKTDGGFDVLDAGQP